MKTTQLLKGILFLGGTLAAFSPSIHAQAIPFTKGRIAMSSDGNHHDPDDIAASATALGMIAAAGLKDEFVLYTYADHVWSNRRNQRSLMINSVTGTASRLGFDTTKFVVAVDDPEGAFNDMRDVILDSTAESPLIILAAGPMEVIGQGLDRAKAINPAALDHVRVVSHSKWNNNHADNPLSDDNPQHSGWTWDEMIEEFEVNGVHFDKIVDQNANASVEIGFSTKKLEGTTNADWSDPESIVWQPWNFMRDYSAHTPEINDGIQFIYSQWFDVVGFPDGSDAGMAYYMITGNELGGPAGLKALFDNGFQGFPRPYLNDGAPRSIPGRLEAEDFNLGGQGLSLIHI